MKTELQRTCILESGTLICHPDTGLYPWHVQELLQGVCECCPRPQGSGWHARTRGIIERKEYPGSPSGRRLLMSDSVTCTEQTSTLPSTKKYILATGRWKADYRADARFQKEWHLGAVNFQKANLIFPST